MIPKGSQRAGGRQLATHLLNEFDNDRVEVAEVRGAIAPDLHGAFAEWSATAKGTRCRKYLYSLSVNPDPEQGPLTRAQYRDFIDRAEQELGLTGQPRALVFHVKHGREHCHAVWSRIDTTKMRAVQISHDRYKLRSVVMEFARDQGLDLPRGVTRDRTRDDGPRRRAENLAEKQQEERTGQTRKERKLAVTDAWNQSADGRSLIRALEERGFLLARGNRRAYVVVDRFGEIHSLARQIKGIRAKDVKARLADFPVETLPDAKRAQEFAREQRETAHPQPEIKAEAQRRREALDAAHAERRARLDKRRTALEAQHRLEREALSEMQDAANRGVALKRKASRPKGSLAFLTRITGIRALTEKREQRQDEQRREEHRRQTAALARRHQREMQDFSRYDRALAKVEAREKRSLRTKLRREEFARISRGPKPPTPPTPPLTPTFDAAVGRGPETSPPPPDPMTPAFREAAQPPEPPERERAGGDLSPDFKQAAAGRPDLEFRGGPDEPPPPDPAPEEGKDDSLSETFDRALRDRVESRSKPNDPDQLPEEGKDESLADTFDRALKERAQRQGKRDDPDLVRDEEKDGSLSETFDRALKDRAERKRKEREQDRDPDRPRGPDPDRGM